VPCKAEDSLGAEPSHPLSQPGQRRQASLYTTVFHTDTFTTAMESIAALGLASNIIQVVDFSSRIISRGWEIYNSTDGRIRDHAILNDAARHLSDLHNDLRMSDTLKFSKLAVADKKLIELKAESQKVVRDLEEALDKAKVSGGKKKWQSVYQALKSVRTESQISSLVDRLETIRKQVDTAVLISIR
jgi:hypothetical protein